jgi:hypothetical protein
VGLFISVSEVYPQFVSSRIFRTLKPPSLLTLKYQAGGRLAIGDKGKDSVSCAALFRHFLFTFFFNTDYFSKIR